MIGFFKQNRWRWILESFEEIIWFSICFFSARVFEATKETCLLTRFNEILNVIDAFDQNAQFENHCYKACGYHEDRHYRAHTFDAFAKRFIYKNQMQNTYDQRADSQ